MTKPIIIMRITSQLLYIIKLEGSIDNIITTNMVDDSFLKGKPKS